MKDGLLVKEILGVQLVVRVKTGGHYGGLNFFEGDKKMYSVSRTRKKNPFVFVATAVFGMWSECGQSCLDIWSQHLACWMLTEQRFGILFRNERKHHIRVPCLNVSIPLPNLRGHLTFMLPCIVIDIFLNNQPDALIIQNVFCYKTLRVSGILSAHHQEFSTVHSALVSFTQFFDDHFQAESGWSAVPT